MSEHFFAQTQYGDLIGTCAFDGHDGSPLGELAELTEMTSDYIPVGFEIHGFSDVESGDPTKLNLTVVAAKRSEVGNGVEQILSFAEREGHIPVYRFDGEMTTSDYIAIFKRTHIVAKFKDYDGKDVKVLP